MPPITCPRCEGKGYLIRGSKGMTRLPCAMCNGTGDRAQNHDSRPRRAGRALRRRSPGAGMGAPANLLAMRQPANLFAMRQPAGRFRGHSTEHRRGRQLIFGGGIKKAGAGSLPAG